jgi:hypothetical protein
MDLEHRSFCLQTRRVLHLFGESCEHLIYAIKERTIIVAYPSVIVASDHRLGRSRVSRDEA